MSDINKAADGVYDVLFKCLPNEAAAAQIRAKPVMLRSAYDKLAPELKARAFTITGITRADVLQGVRDRIAELPEGEDWRDIQSDVLNQISPYFVDPTASAETQLKQYAAANRRSELLIRHHGFQAYQAVTYDIMDRQRDALPYWQYTTVGDSNVRDEHAILDGLTLPADSPFWSDHFPPWEWGCRCQVVPIDRDTFESIQAGDTPGRVLTDRENKELENNGRIADSTSGKVLNVAAAKGEGALSWNPSDMRIPLDDIEKSYDPDVFANFTADMKAAKLPDSNITTWDWLNGEEINPTSVKIKPIANTKTAELQEQLEESRRKTAAAKAQGEAAKKKVDDLKDQLKGIENKNTIVQDIERRIDETEKKTKAIDKKLARKDRREDRT